MIRVSYKGRLGNNLFQYAMGRILADRYGYSLDATPINGFENTKEKIDGLKFDSPLKKLRYNKIPLDRLDKIVEKKNGLHIVLRGTFSYYPNLAPHKKEIREWFDFEPVNLKNLENRFKILKDESYNVVPIDSITNDDVILHIRLGDLLKSASRKVDRAIYFDYYRIILERIKFKRLFIISDSIESEFVKEFRDYNPICLFDTGPVETLKLFKTFNRIIMSRSSFAWWGAWLSDAKEIYFPMIEEGLWGINNLKTDADLRVDEDRYIYVSHKEKKFLGGFDSVRNIYPNMKLRVS